MSWLVTAVGVVLVVATVRDIFHTLFHPSGQGALSQAVMKTVWASTRKLGADRIRALAGPLAVVSTIGTWASLIVLGWTCVYWPWMDESFVFSSGLSPESRSDLLDALYLSLVTGATLGYGDIVPNNEWLRVAAPLQALIGFALWTAAVTWVLQIYPALTRRRSLALRLSHLRDSAGRDWFRTVDSPMVASTIEGLAASVVSVRVDLTQYAETYYFRDTLPAASLPAMLGYAAHLAKSGSESPTRDDVRLAAAMLQAALDDLAEHLNQQFLQSSGAGTDQVLAAFAGDHGHALATTSD